MNINIKIFSSFMLSTLLMLSSCKKEENTFGDLTPPAKPAIAVQVVGKTTAAPNGDGSGKVIVTITSANGINYKVDFGDGTTSSTTTSNIIEHGYSHVGVKDITITAIVSGKAGLSSTGTTTFSILRNYVPPAELVTMLTNDASKTWKVDSVQAGHFGVGPAGSFTADWWQAGPNEKAGLGIYDDEFTFTKTGNTFAHKTNNSLFGKKEYLTDFDATLTGSGDYTLIGATAANYSEAFAYDGVGSAEYLVFTTKGHMGLYVGSHRYQILTRTATQMWLRCIGKDGNAWYVKIKAI